MNIQTASQYMVHGYRMRREQWESKEYLHLKDGVFKKYYLAPEGCSYKYGYAGWHTKLPDLLAEDWEIILEGIALDQGSKVWYEDEIA